MFELSLGELAGYISKRFLIGVWLPVFLFSALALLAAGLAVGPEAAIAALQGLDTATQIWLLALGLIVATAVASVIDHGLVAMTHLYEGYWPDWVVVRPWRAAREQKQRERRDTLRARADPLLYQLQQLELAAQASGTEPPGDTTQPVSQPGDVMQGAPPHANPPSMTRADVRRDLGGVYGELAPSFPMDDAWLMPTQLGNILAAAEEYSERAYGIDAVTVWPRLAQYLPDPFKSQVAESGTALTCMLLSATLSLPFSIGYGLIAVLVGRAWWLPATFIALLAGGLLANGFYRLSLQHAREYGALIRIAWDLYRHDLLRAVRAPLPSSPVDERVMWAQLAEWWTYSLPPGIDEQGHPAWRYRWAELESRDEDDD